MVKRYCNIILDRTGAPPYLWFYCIKYVCYLLNHLSAETLGYKTPIQAATGQIPDISNLLQYHFYQPVYFRERNASFPSESEERLGYWIGISEHCGDELTYEVITADTQQIIPRSTLRPADTPSTQNRRADSVLGETNVDKPIEIVKDRWDDNRDSTSLPLQPEIKPDDLLGRTFLTPENEDGERFRATVIRKIIDGSREYPTNDNIQYLLRIDGDRADQIVSYNEAIDQLNSYLQDDIDQETGEQEFKFREILSHQGPLKTTDPEY